MIPVSTHNPHVLGYQRPARRSVVLCLANFSDWSQFVTVETLSKFLPAAAPLHANASVDLLGGILMEAHRFR